MKVNRLLNLLIVFIALFGFLFLMNLMNKNKKVILSPRLNLPRAKKAYKSKDNRISKSIFFYLYDFFALIVRLEILLFFLVFFNIDCFHLKEEDETTNERYLMIKEDYKLNMKKKERNY